MSQKTAWFLPQGQRGGRDTIRARGMGHYCIPLSISFRWIYPLVIGLPRAERQKFGRKIATPPQKGGGMRSRVAALWDTPLHRPQGVAIVGIYPCGKARKRRPGAA